MVESGVVVDCHWAVLGGLKELNFTANLLWQGADKYLRVSVQLDDMSMFEFPGSGNLSGWLDREELEVTYSHITPTSGDTPEVSNVLSYLQAQQHGVKDFCLRCLVTPRDQKGA